MESKSATKTALISFVLGLASLFTSFVLFISRDTIIKHYYPKMYSNGVEWDCAYIHSENIHAFVVFFLSLFAFGITLFIREVVKDGKMLGLIKWAVLISVIFSGISTSDISDRINHEYEFKPLIDKFIMIMTVILAATQYGNRQNIGTNKGA